MTVRGAAGHLSYEWATIAPAGSLFAPGQSATFEILYSADATMPAEASGGSWTVNWTGTTSP